MIITFAGHREVHEGMNLKERILSAITENIKDRTVYFYCGGYGEFDNMCARIVCELKPEKPGFKSVFVTPYISSTRITKLQSDFLYDEILYADLERVPQRLAILKRNEYMVDKADLVIAYIEREEGGAYSAVKYAKKLNKKVVNIGSAEDIENEENK